MEANAEDIIQGGLTPTTVLRILAITTLACLAVTSNLFFLYEMGVADKTVIESHGKERLYEGEDAPGYTVGMHEITADEREFLKSHDKRVLTPDERSQYPNLIGSTSPDNIRTDNGYYTYESNIQNLFEWAYFLGVLPVLICVGFMLRSWVTLGSSLFTMVFTIPYAVILEIVGCPL